MNLIAHLLLARLPQAGPAVYRRLREAFGSPEQILETDRTHLAPYLPEAARQALDDYDRNPDGDLARAAAADADWLAGHPEVLCLPFESPDYPDLLRRIDHPPPLLYVRGRVEALELPQIAMVGSRNPSPGGRDNAYQFAHYLACGGFAVTSGLALGVDGCSHEGALDAGGTTLAVMGTGIDRVYPARHRALAERIVDSGGALVTEFPLGTGSVAANFPRRNRIISGLSLGTLVAEAAVRSGSLITARCALEQEREVFAIPGSIHNPMARGAHSLIKRGAKLVECADDIVEELGGALAHKRDQLEPTTGPELDHSERSLLAALGHDPVSLDTLSERVSLGPGELSALLMGLEVKGLISQSGSYYSRRQ